MKSATPFIFLALYYLFIPSVFVFSKGVALRQTGWRSKPFRTALGMFFASAAVAFLLFLTANLITSLLGRDSSDAVTIIFLPLICISPFVVDGIILVRMNRPYHQDKPVWCTAVVINLASYLTTIVMARLFETITSKL